MTKKRKVMFMKRCELCGKKTLFGHRYRDGKLCRSCQFKLPAVMKCGCPPTVALFRYLYSLQNPTDVQSFKATVTAGRMSFDRPRRLIGIKMYAGSKTIIFPLSQIKDVTLELGDIGRFGRWIKGTVYAIISFRKPHDFTLNIPILVGEDCPTRPRGSLDRNGWRTLMITEPKSITVMRGQIKECMRQDMLDAFDQIYSLLDELQLLKNAIGGKEQSYELLQGARKEEYFENK
jgi:hypothetical protein